MGQSPVLVLVVIVCILAFEGLIFGEELAEMAFDESIDQPEGNIFDAIFGIIDTIWGVVEFIFGLLTFNIPGAPWFVRLVGGMIFSGGLIWSVATLIRGN